MNSFTPNQIEALRSLDCPRCGHPLDVAPTHYECSGSNCTFIITKRDYGLVVDAKQA